MNQIKKFNFLLEELLDKLVEKFNNNKLKSYRRFFIFMKTASPKTPVNIFMSGCINYKEHIKNRDDVFFLTNETIKEKSKVFGNFTEDCGISEYWNVLSNKTKNSIWEYIQSLFVLGEIIINDDNQLFEKYMNKYVTDFRNDILNISDEQTLLDKINS